MKSHRAGALLPLFVLALVMLSASAGSAELLRKVKRIDGNSPLGQTLDGLPLVQDAGMSHYQFNKGARNLTIHKVKAHQVGPAQVKAHQRWCSSKGTYISVRAHQRAGSLHKSSVRGRVTVGISQGTSRYVFEPPLAEDPITRLLPTTRGIRVKIPQDVLKDPGTLHSLLTDKAR